MEGAPYEPTQEEIKKAQEFMSVEQMDMTNVREKLGLLKAGAVSFYEKHHFTGVHVFSKTEMSGSPVNRFVGSVKLTDKHKQIFLDKLEQHNDWFFAKDIFVDFIKNVKGGEFAELLIKLGFLEKKHNSYPNGSSYDTYEKVKSSQEVNIDGCEYVFKPVGDSIRVFFKNIPLIDFKIVFGNGGGTDFGEYFYTRDDTVEDAHVKLPPNDGFPSPVYFDELVTEDELNKIKSDYELRIKMNHLVDKYKK